MRGKPIVIDKDGVIVRITPADAGKTNSRSLRLSWAEDHPRGCGENMLRS